MKFAVLFSLVSSGLGFCLQPLTSSPSLIRLQKLKRQVGESETLKRSQHFVSSTLAVCENPGTDLPSGTSPQGRMLLQSLQRITRGFLVLLPDFSQLLKEKAAGSRSRACRDGKGTHVPCGPRWAIAGANTDLSGTWAPIVTAEFRKAFENFLLNTGQSYLARKVIVNGLTLHREHVDQKASGRELNLVSSNPAGQWSRTLVASGSDRNTTDFSSLHQVIHLSFQ